MKNTNHAFVFAFERVKIAAACKDNSNDLKIERKKNRNLGSISDTNRIWFECKKRKLNITNQQR